MMSLRVLSSLRNLPRYLKQSSLHVHTSVISLNSKKSEDSSSSDSSDSSDSDSDKERGVKSFAKKSSTESSNATDESLKTSDVNERLNALLEKINEAAQKRKVETPNEKSELNIEGLPSFISTKSKTTKPKFNLNKITKTKKADVDYKSTTNEKTINVAIKPKSIRFGQISKEEKLKQKPHEHQIKEAVKEVAESLGGDTQKTELELLSKALNFNQESPDTVSTIKEEETPTDLSGLLSKMKVETSSPGQKAQRKSNNVKPAKSKVKKSSIAESVLYTKSITKPKSYAEPGKSELNVSVQAMGILKKISTDNKDQLELPTWNTMEKREMRLAELTVPQNVFQELIQWTNEGKIWHFPIDNEQGMEGETDVHFSEHVFMERHLKGWCPKRGPIRHFMELVCTGLSKNPYMTVEEKVGHITWYKNYFEDKKELLHELGVLDDKKPTDKKQIEA